MARQKKYTDLPDRNHPDYMKLYVAKRKDELKEQQKVYRSKRLEDNPNHYKEHYKKYEQTSRQWRTINKPTIAENQWKSRGIVDMSYEKFLCELDKQDYKCMVCNKELTNPQVDHDHNTGKYRGILCVPCNNGLGVYEKKKDLFENYLKRIAK
jgi:DNA-directed RNA polymerase subunit RPC12/RpoP